MDTDTRPEHDETAAPSERREDAEAKEGGDERPRRGNRHHAYRRKNRRRGERQANAEPDSASPTSAQMRGARASGRTPGISTAEEPAAAPLGTDDEAAGRAAGPAELARETERAEQEAGMQGLGAEEAMRGRPGHPEESPRSFGALVAIAAAVVILALLAILLF